MIRRLLTLITWPLLLPIFGLRWLVDRLRAPTIVLTVDLEGVHPHRAQSAGLLNKNPPNISRRALRRRLARAHKDARIQTVLVRIGPVAGGRASLYELRRQINALRVAGKRVIAFVAIPETTTLWLASAADEVLIPEDAPVMATGVSAEMSFYGAALEKLGVEVEVLAHGRFKSAMEPFAREEPSEANREMIDALLDDLYAGMIADIAEGRGTTAETILDAFEVGVQSPEAAISAGLVDGIIAEEDLPERLDFHADGEATRVAITDYSGRPRPWPRFQRRSPLAVVEVRGAIRDGRHRDPAPHGAVTKAVCGALDQARKDKRIKGVLLHVDSRGGSAMASERMWRAVRRLAEKKPVIAWMGDAAASGGYYVACGAHQIVAAPGTLTGSIGVIAAKPVISKLLGRLGINRVRFERGPQSTLFSLSRGFTKGERTALEAVIARTYGLFIRRVAESRACTEAEIDALGQGRVWTGAQALENGLVDVLGDEADAVRLLAEKVGVQPPATIRRIGPRIPWRHRIRSRLGLSTPGLTLLDLGRESEILAWCPLDPR